LTSNVGDVRLISAVEDCLSVKPKGWHRWFGLELLNVDIVLHVHLQDGITSTLGLDFDGSPGVWNLKKIGDKTLIGRINSLVLDTESFDFVK